MKKIIMFLLILLVSITATGCQYLEQLGLGDISDLIFGSSEVEINGITISSADNVREISVGATLQLTAVVYPAEASQEVVWSSENNSIATVSETGVVTGVGVGTTSIVATSTANPSVSNKYAIIVNKAVINPESVTITGEVSTCTAGEKVQLTATVLPTEAKQSVDWSSSDTSIATVNRSGLVSALKEGTVTITATSTEVSTVTNTYTLTVEAPEVPLNPEWTEMPYSTHEDYINKDNEEKLKIKGVVTHVSPVSNDTVSYFIQSGNDGYYVYAQNSTTFPVELGKSYEVGGYKKYYKGLNEIVDVEHFVEIANETFNYIDVNNTNPSDKEAMKVYQGSYVTGSAVLVSGTVNTTKAYNITAKINGNDTTLRVDPAYAGSEEFAKICTIFSTAPAGTAFEFKGLMTAYGNYEAAVATQIQIVKASDLQFAEANVEDVLKACLAQITVSSSISMNKNEITLPTSMTGFDDVTVSWASDSSLINVTTGAVSHDSTNKVVTLTVTLSKDGTTVSKEFKVTVLALDTTEHEVLVSLDLEDAALEGNYGCSSTKPGYAAGVVTLGTPAYQWLLQNSLIAFSSDDKTEGSLSIRSKAGKDASATGRIEIKQAGEYNIVQFAGAAYGNHALTTQIRIEYTLDDGATWLVAETIITLDSPTLETYRVYLPEGAKRVAIVVVENSGTTVNIDSIKLMK